jgi:hypothetical protein
LARKLVFITIAFVSFSTLLFELLQTRMLSFIFWHHIVYLTVSMALLGFGISGTLVAIFQEKFTVGRRLMSRLVSGFGISAMLAVVSCSAFPVIDRGPINFLARLVFSYVVFLLPFVFSGSIISLILSSRKLSVGKLYAVDLIAAALGCALVSTLLLKWGPQRVSYAIGVFSGILAWMWCKRSDVMSRAASISTIILGLGLLIGPQLSIYPVFNKELFSLLEKKGATLEHTEWTPLCRIDVIGSQLESLLVNLNKDVSTLRKPDMYKVLTQDASAHTQIYSRALIVNIWDSIRKRPFHIDPRCAPYWLKQHPEIGIIGTGGGFEVICALGYGAKSIEGAELNPITYRLMKSTYSDYCGHFLEDPRVVLKNEEGRAMLRHLTRKLDIIFVEAVDTYAAMQAGAYVLGESYLYTVEALQEMMSKLNNDGMLTFYRWAQLPPTESLRLCGLACEVYRRMGITGFEKNIVCMIPDEAQPSITCVFKKSAFTPKELGILINASKDNNAKIIYFPKVFPKGEQKILEDGYYSHCDANTLEFRTAFNGMIAAFVANRESEFIRSYPYQLSLSTDDSPFLFACYPQSPSGLPLVSLRYLLNSSHMVLLVALCESIIASVVAIFWPLWHYKREGIKVPFAGHFVVYFAAVGFGFMLVELCLVQKSVLLLGNPLYALSVVLGTILLSAGLGSYIQGRVNCGAREGSLFFSACFLGVLGLLIFGLTPLIYSCLTYDLPVRMLLTFLILMPCGICMGTFFPIGLKAIKDLSPDFVPWAWGINGCASVFGSFAAITLAIWLGFTWSLSIGACTYAVAAIAARRFLV